MQQFRNGAAAALASGGFVEGASVVTWLSAGGAAPVPVWQGPAPLEEEPFVAQCFGSSATETRQCDSDLAGPDGMWSVVDCYSEYNEPRCTEGPGTTEQEVLGAQGGAYSATLGWVLALIAAGVWCLCVYVCCVCTTPSQCWSRSSWGWWSW